MNQNRTIKTSNSIMKYLSITFILCFQILLSNEIQSPQLIIQRGQRSETHISIDAQTHLDYGLIYPITYEFNIPVGSENLKSFRKFQSSGSWIQMVEKTPNDFFNGIEVVRFDYTENIAYVSIGFSSISDSIFIKLTDESGNNIEASYLEMSEYYDNRDAVVTATADDWASWNNDVQVQACELFRDYNLWLSQAIIPGGADENTWADIQTQIDLGLIEPLSHSRSHPYIPYEDLEGEVLGSKQDLIDNLDFPSLNRSGSNEYIYVWVAPYGEYDAGTDAMVSIGKYLVSRMYTDNDFGFSEWDQTYNKFGTIGVSTEVGPYYIGSTDTEYLNNTFDDVILNGGIYHVMLHPAFIDWEQNYLELHLQHINDFKNIWYVGFGHLYAYHFLQTAYTGMTLSNKEENSLIPKDVIIQQNYPNPFNPTTTLNYYLPENTNVNISIYDLGGQLVKTLVNSKQSSGNSSIQWNSTNNDELPVSAGLYFYTIQAGDFRQTKKMVLLK